MALLKDYYCAQSGVTISNAYWKVDAENGIIGGKLRLHVKMNCFKNKSTANTNTSKLADFDFLFMPNLYSITNFIAQAYLYAKTLPQFFGAIDA